jgi:hypothetical protein
MLVFALRLGMTQRQDIKYAAKTTRREHTLPRKG